MSLSKTYVHWEEILFLKDARPARAGSKLQRLADVRFARRIAPTRLDVPRPSEKLPILQLLFESYTIYQDVYNRPLWRTMFAFFNRPKKKRLVEFSEK